MLAGVLVKVEVRGGVTSVLGGTQVLGPDLGMKTGSVTDQFCPCLS